MQTRHIPAVSIAVIKDGVIVKDASYGIADVENNVPATPSTIYKIGSTLQTDIRSLRVFQTARLSISFSAE